jgi:hypothetical protein
MRRGAGRLGVSAGAGPGELARRGRCVLTTMEGMQMRKARSGRKARAWAGDGATWSRAQADFI